MHVREVDFEFSSNYWIWKNFCQINQGGSHVFETGRAPAVFDPRAHFAIKTGRAHIGLYTYLVQKLPVPGHGGHIR